MAFPFFLRRRLVRDFGRANAVHVVVDLTRMSAGGRNGGIKPFVLSFLDFIASRWRDSFRFTYLVSPEFLSEICLLVRPTDSVICLDDNSGASGPTGVTRRARLICNAPDSLAADLKGDVLYCPFGYSRFFHSDIPAVSLIVDLLHRDLPAALPAAEVNDRERRFRKTAESAVAFQCNSMFVARRFQDCYGVDPSRLFHTYNAVHERLPASPPGECATPGEAPYFFYPANFWPHKNHEGLLRAFRIYRDSTSRPWELVCTGFPSDEIDGIRRMAGDLGITDLVRFPGYLDEEQFSLVWLHAGALAFPSLYEGFGIPLLEAMHFGIPILCHDNAVMREVAGDCALYVDARCPQSLAKGLLELAGNEPLRKKLVDKGTNRLHRFSLDREARKLASTLHRAAARVFPNPLPALKDVSSPC